MKRGVNLSRIQKVVDISVLVACQLQYENEYPLAICNLRPLLHDEFVCLRVGNLQGKAARTQLEREKGER
jgi:hypothetical protein